MSETLRSVIIVVLIDVAIFHVLILTLWLVWFSMQPTRWNWRALDEGWLLWWLHAFFKSTDWASVPLTSSSAV